MVGVLLVFFFVLYTKIFVLMISTMPDKIMAWIDAQAGGLGGEEASGMAPLATSGVATAKGASMLGSAASGAASGGHALYKKIKGGDDKDKPKGGDSPANMTEKTTE